MENQKQLGERKKNATRILLSLEFVKKLNVLITLNQLV